jgi:hypothetical protein
MKRLYSACIFVFFAILAFHCQKEFSVPGGIDPNIPNTTTPAPVNATLQGNVFDKNGDPAMDVTVKVGSKTATTDVRGYFRIVDASLDKNASLVTAEKAGYFKAYRTFSATSGVNQVTIKLIEKTTAGTIDASSGGNVTLTNGSKIVLPANGVVKASGGSYSGPVNVHAAYIDPTASDINEIVPGSFIANDKNNQRVTLSSYGMLAVELESPAGEKLQIASGSKATLTTPIPASVQSSAPATISLWYVDEQTGIWKEEGTATKNGTNYVGDVSHFSYWNCDIPVPTVGFTATIVTAAGPLVYAYVKIRPASGSYSGYAHGHTDSLGQLAGIIPANMSLILEVMDNCGNPVYTQNIGPFSSSVNLGTITVTGATSHIVTIKGKLVNCSNTAVTDGYALIVYDYYTRYATVDNNGQFSVTLITCNSSAAFCEILGIDEGAQQQGATVNVPVITPVTDAGNISACGTSTTQFINYNLDGTNYSIDNSQDSLIAYVTQGGTTTQPVQIMLTGINASDHITIKTNTTGVPGTFDIVMLQVQNYNNTTVGANTATVTFTRFATAIGQFYEGSFFANFFDSSSPTTAHTISGSFRIRKNW